MKVYKIKIPSYSDPFYTNEPSDLKLVPVGSIAEVVEMTSEEYYHIPATNESALVFGR